MSELRVRGARRDGHEILFERPGCDYLSRCAHHRHWSVPSDDAKCRRRWPTATWRTLANFSETSGRAKVRYGGIGAFLRPRPSPENARPWLLIHGCRTPNGKRVVIRTSSVIISRRLYGAAQRTSHSSQPLTAKGQHAARPVSRPVKATIARIKPKLGVVPSNLAGPQLIRLAVPDRQRPQPASFCAHQCRLFYETSLSSWQERRACRRLH
jgi:hypothetical protein